MMQTLIRIVHELSQSHPEFGHYKSHAKDANTQGFNVLTSKGYTLGISQELVSDFENNLVTGDDLQDRVKIKRSPTNG